MKFRQARKIMVGNSNLHKKFSKLRPPYINEAGIFVHPTWSNFSIVIKARKVYLRHIKRNKKKRFL
jgi:hypothetical protein